MSDDVLITPASRKIEFKDSGGTVDAKIETDSSGNLTITNPGGDISLGDTTADVIIGDGVNSVDLIMEVNGEIRGTSGVTITLGDSGSNISMGTDLGLNSNDITGTGNVNITGGITVTGNVTAAAFYGDGSNLTGITATGAASVGTSATLQTKINALSATMATSINNRTAAITSVNTRINSVSALAASVSSTMATSINNRTAAIASVNNVMMRKSATTNLDMNNFNITEVNALTFNDPGPQEGINFNGGNLWKIYESPDDLTTNSSGNLQFAKNTTRSMTLNTNGNLFVSGNVTATSFYGDGSNLTGITATGASVGTSATLQTKINALSATMATSINNRTAAITSVNTRIGTVSAITSSNVDAISSVNTRIGTVSAITSSNAVAIANLSAGEILTRLKTVDGSGSGLDADLFDGLQSGVFLRSSQSDTMSGTLTVTGNVTASAFYGDGSNLTGITASNADTVDNLHASSFLRSDANDIATGEINLQNNLDMASDNGTASRFVHLPRGGGITFYGDDIAHHSITSRNAAGTVGDDLTISSYGGVHIDLDSNNNNTSEAEFTIGRHGTSTPLFTFSGEGGGIGFGQSAGTYKLSTDFGNSSSGPGIDFVHGYSSGFKADAYYGITYMGRENAAGGFVCTSTYIAPGNGASGPGYQATTNTVDFGTSSVTWKNIYAGTAMYVDGNPVATTQFNTVGSYCLAHHTSSNSSLTANANISGSSLRAVGFFHLLSTQSSNAYYPEEDGSALSGTWRVMGEARDNSAPTSLRPATLFVRIS